MRALSAKAISQSPIRIFPPCYELEQVYLTEMLVFTNNPSLQFYRRRVTMIELADIAAARGSDFVLVKKVGDGVERSYRRYNSPEGGKRG
jgi:hypothetical protein